MRRRASSIFEMSFRCRSRVRSSRARSVSDVARSARSGWFSVSFWRCVTVSRDSRRISSFQFISFCLKYSSCRSFMNGSSSVGRYSAVSARTVAVVIDASRPLNTPRSPERGLITKAVERSMKLAFGGRSCRNPRLFELCQLNRGPGFDLVQQSFERTVLGGHPLLAHGAQKAVQVPPRDFAGAADRRQGEAALTARRPGRLPGAAERSDPACPTDFHGGDTPLQTLVRPRMSALRLAAWLMPGNFCRGPARPARSPRQHTVFPAQYSGALLAGTRGLVRRLGGSDMRPSIVGSLVLVLALVMAGPSLAAYRIKDVVAFEGVRENQLTGYGLVVGLNGTGDNLRNAPMTRQSLEAMFERLGRTVPATHLNTKNVAVVMVTAKLPPFAASG